MQVWLFADEPLPNRKVAFGCWGTRFFAALSGANCKLYIQWRHAEKEGGGMPRLMSLREMSNEEVETVRKLAHARTLPARTVERAGIIWLASRGERVNAIAQQLHLNRITVRRWIARFNKGGVASLGDEPRVGRPPRTHGSKGGRGAG